MWFVISHNHLATYSLRYFLLGVDERLPVACCCVFISCWARALNSAAGANSSAEFFISTPFITTFSTTSLCLATLSPALSFILATFLLPSLAIECFRTLLHTWSPLTVVTYFNFWRGWSSALTFCCHLSGVVSFPFLWQSQTSPPFCYCPLAHRLSFVDNIKIGTDKVVNRQLINILFRLMLLFLSVFISVLENYNVIAVRLVFRPEALTRVQAFIGRDLDVFD
jgi:hypothetical protein